MEASVPRSNVAVVIPAAGLGKRLGGKRKQFRTLGDAPLLVQTLRVFESIDAVKSIVVAAPAEEAEQLFADCRAAGISKLISVVPGGETRQASVVRALEALPDDTVYVLVHDAVRPFVSPQAIGRVVDAVEEHGAASLALAVTDTLRRGSEEFFSETVDRENVYRMQTPQGFQAEVLRQAYTRAAREGWEVTDDVEAVRRCGLPVAIVPGEEMNIKITSPSDWSLAQLIWQHRTPQLG
jgi:2-C-methyl-D-erythritol 4-phosphate cytidylyltransferase